MGHHHDHAIYESGQRRLVFSIVLNLVITLAEVIGGIMANSLALLSDALHNFSDVSSLAISFFARKISRKKADKHRTYGYRRAEIIGAFINLITLVLLTILLIQHAIQRFFDEQAVVGPVMMIVAFIGLVANLLTAVLLHRDSKTGLNMRSAFLHILTDTLSSVAVLATGFLIYLYDLYLLDALITLLIAFYVLAQSFGMLKTTISILMQSTPDHLDRDEVVRTLRRLDEVADIHHVHIWQLDEHSICFDSHVVISEDRLPRMESVKQAIRMVLHDQFGIGHSTLEFETEPCSQPQTCEMEPDH